MSAFELVNIVRSPGSEPTGRGGDPRQADRGASACGKPIGRDKLLAARLASGVVLAQPAPLPKTVANHEDGRKMDKHRTIDSRAGSLLSDALAIQLNLLHRFLPMRGWIVARCDGATVDLLATAGDLTAASAGAFECQCLCDPRAPEDDRFTYRQYGQREVSARGAERADEWCVTHLFRADLALPGDSRYICVLGLQSQAQTVSLRSAEIELCLSALLRTLRLHEALVETETKMRMTRHEASRDALTGVLNRAGWDDYLRQINAELGNAGDDTRCDALVGFLDLDFLKCINDRFGHVAGDDVLKRTARTVQAVLRQRDCVARLGGDEFAILLPHVTPRGAELLKARLTAALRAADISVSIGFALQSEAGSLDEAVKLADARMYRNKRNRPLAVRHLDSVFACSA